MQLQLQLHHQVECQRHMKSHDHEITHELRTVTGACGASIQSLSSSEPAMYDIVDALRSRLDSSTSSAKLAAKARSAEIHLSKVARSGARNLSSLSFPRTVKRCTPPCTTSFKKTVAPSMLRSPRAALPSLNSSSLRQDHTADKCVSSFWACIRCSQCVARFSGATVPLVVREHRFPRRKHKITLGPGLQEGKRQPDRKMSAMAFERGHHED